MRYWCFVDASGDAGRFQSPSLVYGIAFVIIEHEALPQFREHYHRFRLFLHTAFQLPLDYPLSVHEIVHRKGVIATLSLSSQARRNLFRAILRFQRTCALIQTFAIVADKRNLRDVGPWDEPKLNLRPVGLRWACWGYAAQWMERIQLRAGFKPWETDNWQMLDEGYAFARVDTHHGQNRTRVASEEPLVQFASCNAYAACRVLLPTQQFDQTLWEQLGAARVNDDFAHRPGLYIVT